MGYRAFILAIVTAGFMPVVAHAHAFGQQFALPLPVTFYIFGGTAAFLISATFLSFVGKRAPSTGKSIELPKGVWTVVEVGLQAVFLITFLGGLGFGFFGPQSAFYNPLPYLFWIGLVLIVPYVSVLVAGLWDTANPFKTLLSFLSWPLPAGKKEWKHGYVPAIVLYVGLIVLELFFPRLSTNPQMLAALLVLYAVYLTIGSFRYGARDWFRYADIFTVFMRLAGMLAPLRIADGRVVFGGAVRGLVTETSSRLSLVAFILFALAATAYDGFRETTFALRLILDTLQTPWLLTQFAIFILFPIAFWALYALTLFVMKGLAGGTKSVSEYMRRFAYSLVPIVLAYHFAHYFSLMLSTLGIVIDADIVWYVQLATIVFGHAFAAYVAHQIALMEFPTKRAALVSQIPLVLLMVFYTAFGLWILSQPFAP